MERKALEMENHVRGRPGGSDVASPQPTARRGKPAQIFPADAADPDGRLRMDGVIFESEPRHGKRFGRRLTGRSR
jgi:hypothetical protein